MKIAERSIFNVIGIGSAICLFLWIAVFVSLVFSLPNDIILPFNETFYAAAFTFGYFGTPILLLAGLALLYFFNKDHNRPLQALDILLRIWLVFHLLFLVFLGTEYFGSSDSANTNALYLAIFYGFIIYPILAITTTICGFSATRSHSKIERL